MPGTLRNPEHNERTDPLESDDLQCSLANSDKLCNATCLNVQPDLRQHFYPPPTGCNKSHTALLHHMRQKDVVLSSGIGRRYPLARVSH